MSDSEHTHHGTHHGNYIKIWAILVVLLLVSVAGPMLEIQAVTLFTAFGIALIKAYLVAKNFMHLNVERRYVVYILCTALGFMMLFFAGTAPDVMQHSGTNWTKPDWVAAAIADGAAPPSGHGGDHH
ncbi:MAG: cytochrome C oxidase subunit IV family protein [Deltaproteobacteria bacterium]|nr:cytochrome C oxidase subunit IV family protein [Deltaproteobacteria bacterium]MBW2418630.1 cytochrome C oxidase subunit IV family protein [Deltaproteobacteria bacterium]